MNSFWGTFLLSDAQNTARLYNMIVTITSFATCLCRLHVVGQQIVSDISVVSDMVVEIIRSPCFESNNTNLLLRLMYLERLFCFKYQT